MPVIVNVYKDAYFLDAYSKDQDMSDPVFMYPPIDFDGDVGQTRDVQCWFRNDGDLIIRDLALTPYDLVDSDESTWMKLALTQGGLAGATPGAALEYGSDLDPAASFTFWERMTVPAATAAQNKLDLCLRITCKGYAS